jgi:pyrroline-5-carboxylate reductase
MRKVLREEMGFDGVLISDFAAIDEMIRHGIAEDSREAALLAIEAGVDIDMQSNAYMNHLVDLVRCGEVDEKLIDAASALSGSGPAYLYVMLEALADGAVACGLPRAKAMEYAAMTMAGAAEMYLATKQHPGALKDAVCSPGGSTIAGIRELENHGFRAAAMDCVIATYRRNKELGK